MVEIEFLDPEDSPRNVRTDGGEEIGREPTRWASFDTGLLGSCVLLATAAVLAVLAPFQQLLVIRQPGAGESLTFAIDGWGRVTINADRAARSGFHLSRFGLPLVICAAVLTLVVLILAAAAAGLRIAERVLAPAAVAAVAITGVLTGVLVAMWLLVDAQFDSSRPSTVDVEVGPTMPTNHYGACIWLAAAAVVAAAMGIGALARRRRD
jgi:hypothetical protein